MGKKKKGGKASKEEKEGDVVAGGDEPVEPVVVEESLTVKRFRASIQRAWSVFDKEEEGRVVQEEVGSIIRYLGRFPSEAEIADVLLPVMQNDEPDAYVTFEKFEPVVLSILQQGEYPPDGQEIILSAFKALDEEKKGYLDADYLSGLMTQMGTPLRPKEMESFFGACKDGSTGRVYYEDYALLYAQQVDANANRWEDESKSRIMSAFS